MSDLSSLTTAREKFINHLKNQNRAHATILAYGKDTEQLTTFLQLKEINEVASVTTPLIEEFKKYLLEQKYTPKSTARKLNALKTFFRFLIDEGLISQNPVAKVSQPKYEISPPRILSPMEYRSLRDAARGDSRMGAIIEMLLQTGIRIGELSRLKLEDIKPDHTLVVHAYESRKEREIPLNHSALKSLDDYLRERPNLKTKSLFVTKSGRPFLIRNIRSAIERYFRVAGIDDAKVNDLRHTFIAHQLANGNSVVLIQKLVGHKRLSTTERYLEFVDRQPQKEIDLKEL